MVDKVAIKDSEKRILTKIIESSRDNLDSSKIHYTHILV